MVKVSIEEIEAQMLECKVEPKKVQEVISALEAVAEELAAERKAMAEPKQKWEYVIVLNDKHGVLVDQEIAGWVVQHPEEDDAGLVLSKLTDAVKAHNSCAKKKDNRIESLVSAFEHVKGKFTKEHDLRIKTKELTRVIITNGKLP